MFTELRAKKIAKYRYKWRLTDTLRFALTNDGNTILCEVPKHTVTDGYSIPRVFWWFLAPDCMDLRPAILHDEMCRQQWWDSKVVHAIFWENVEQLAEPKWKRWLVGYSVWLFGPSF